MAVRKNLALAILLSMGLALPALAQSPSGIPQAEERLDALGEDVVKLAGRTLNALQKNSIKGRREYCGFIGRVAGKGLVATRARPGTQASCTMPRMPASFKPIASYHTHGAFDLGYDNEMPSYQDLRGDIDVGIDGFISTPGGRFWFSDKQGKEVRLICGARCLITDPSYSEERHDPVGEAYSLKDLARR